MVPVQPMMIVTERAFVASVDPQHASPLGPLPRVVDGPPKSIEDPTAATVGTAVVAAQPLPLANPAPLLRLTLPDPYARLRAVQFSQPPVDLDGPEASRLRPPSPQLPLEAANPKP
jgi:hypothetical protein